MRVVVSAYRNALSSGEVHTNVSVGSGLGLSRVLLNVQLELLACHPESMSVRTHSFVHCAITRTQQAFLTASNSTQIHDIIVSQHS